MSLVDFAPAPRFVSAPLAGLVRRLGNWSIAWRHARAQRLATQSMLFMPEHRLNDLGIRREQLIQATEIHRK